MLNATHSVIYVYSVTVSIIETYSTVLRETGAQPKAELVIDIQRLVKLLVQAKRLLGNVLV